MARLVVLMDFPPLVLSWLVVLTPPSPLSHFRIHMSPCTSLSGAELVNVTTRQQKQQQPPQKRSQKTSVISVFLFARALPPQPHPALPPLIYVNFITDLLAPDQLLSIHRSTDALLLVWFYQKLFFLLLIGFEDYTELLLNPSYNAIQSPWWFDKLMLGQCNAFYLHILFSTAQSTVFTWFISWCTGNLYSKSLALCFIHIHLADRVKRVCK